MKKLFTSLLLMLISFAGLFPAFGQQPASVTVPEPAETYTIFHSSGYYLARMEGEDAERPKITTRSNEADQAFQFEPVPEEEGTYYIKNMKANEYLIRASNINGWTMGWTTVLDTLANPQDAKYQVMVLEDTEEYIQIKNLGSDRVLGVDESRLGATVYGDKSGTTEPRYRFSIRIFEENVDKQALTSKYEEAKNIFDTTESGTGSDQYPAGIRSTLQDKLLYAEEVLENESVTQSEVNFALTDLTATLELYLDSVYPFLPNTSTTYYIAHSSGLYFTDVPQIKNPTYAVDQQFQFEEVSGNPDAFLIKSVSTGLYMTRNENGYSVSWGESRTTELAHFELKKIGTEYYRINCLGVIEGKTTSYLGTDNNTDGSGVYLDKNGLDGKHHWKFIDLNELGVVKEELETSITKADEFLANAEKGTAPDQYPEIEYDALDAILQSAKTLFANENATQEEVNGVAKALTDALAECIAAVNPLLPETGVDYYLIHSSGLYMGEYSNDTNQNTLAIFANGDQDNQKFRFVAVTENPGVFNITINSLPGKFLTRSTEPHPTEPDNYNDYQLIWGEDPVSEFAQFTMTRNQEGTYYRIKCITPGPKRANSYFGTDNATDSAGVYVDKDGTNENHLWSIVKVSDVGISNPDQDNLTIVTSNNMLKIDGMEGRNTVYIYAVSGALVSKAVVNTPDYSVQLDNGMYIITVNGDTTFRGKALVK